ncbi:hypothetical protein [Sphingomonas bisphenolicum]|nr:hypothetical protein [Sphingomonas bisphenolicum]
MIDGLQNCDDIAFDSDSVFVIEGKDSAVWAAWRNDTDELHVHHDL